MTRPAGLPDFDFIYELYMHPLVNPFLLYETMDAEAFHPIFEDLIRAAVVYIYSDDGPPAGMFKLIPLQHRNHHVVYLGGLALYPEFSGKGAGNRMVKEIIAFASRQGILRIELSVSVENEKAIRLYEKNGFQQEGILRKFTHLKSEERFIDEVLMSYIF